MKELFKIRKQDDVALSLIMIFCTYMSYVFTSGPDFMIVLWCYVFLTLLFIGAMEAGKE